MTKKTENKKAELMKARLVRGFMDQDATVLYQTEKMLDIIQKVYVLHGFEAIETPFIEYSDVLGKFLPDQDRPNEGVFSFQDEDEQWLSLRYDLTAPLARFVAQNFESLAKPYRSYRKGWVFRNEKAGPGRFRQFMQFDADIVGSASILADAEICMLAADALAELGLKPEEYVIRVNNRKILDGILECAGLQGDGYAATRLIVLRAIDKLDKFGLDGVQQLLGKGRLDESGDFTKGAQLDEKTIDYILSYLSLSSHCGEDLFVTLRQLVAGHEIGLAGVDEIEEIYHFVVAAGYLGRIVIDPSVVRGLEYYTGPVFEASLLMEVPNEAGQTVVFGSIGGGGRYDTLVSRFRSEAVPATGFSIGLSRLITALQNLQKMRCDQARAPVLVAVMDRDSQSLQQYQKMVQSLHAEDIQAELYVGTAGLKAQMKYADRRGAPCVIIQGSREMEDGVVQIKDLAVGAKLSQEITDNTVWRQSQPAQVTVPLAEMITHVKKILKG